jgi:hypothetical protein
MRAIGWSNGSPRQSGAGYGIRINKHDRDQYFDRAWDEILIECSGVNTTVTLSDSFWSECSELRSAAIGRWLLREGLAPWPPRQPPVIDLVALENNVFEIARPYPR